MMYHAQSFAENGFMTDIVGYGGVYHLEPLLAVGAEELRLCVTKAPTSSLRLNACHECKHDICPNRQESCDIYHS